MSIFKKFFEKKKLDTKFKHAGQGHKLTDPTTPSSSSGKLRDRPTSTQPVRGPPSASARMAGVAALQRIENQNVPSMVNRSQNVIRAEARKELQAEAQSVDSLEVHSLKEIDRDVATPANSVFFKCPLIGSYVLPKKDIDEKIREFLYEQLDEEPGLVSCLIIKTCNKSQENIQICVDTLTKCLNNVLEHPDEEKYRKIRVKSNAFQAKVIPIEGSLEFLQAVGFTKQLLPHIDAEEEEEFYVLSSDCVNRDEIETLRDALITAEAVRPELDRNVKVLSYNHQLEKIDLPADFYRLTLEELKQEQQYRTEVAEKNLMLRTKAMRERDALRERRLYRYCFMRIRFPDGLMLQGTFKTWEKLSDVRIFLTEHLIYDGIPFTLGTSNGQRLTEYDLTLAELGLIPAVVIHFAWDSAVDVCGATGNVDYLKPETLALCTEL